MQQLAPVQQFINLPGCTLLRNGMQIEAGLSDDDLKGIGTTLNAIEQCGLWWWGDYLNHVTIERGETYTDGILTSAYSYGALRNAKWVCSKFDLSHRCDRSYSHHLEALGECSGDVEEAFKWVRAAEVNGWSVSDMRRAIRVAKAEHGPQKEKQEASAYDFIKELKQWARKDLPTASKELLNEIEHDLSELLEQVRQAKAA